MSKQLELFNDDPAEDIQQLASLMSFPNQVDESLLRDAFKEETGHDLFSLVRDELAAIYSCHTAEVTPLLRRRRRRDLMRQRLTSPGKKPSGKASPDLNSVFRALRK